MSNMKSSSVQDDIRRDTSTPSGQPSGQPTQKIPNRRSLKKADKPPSQKSAGAFRTISEVADELKVEQHVLRFWETKFTQIKPMKRGGGRRYYRPEDIDLIKNIHHLLYQEGYTIKGVQKLLSSHRGNLAGRMTDAAQSQTQQENPLSKVVEKNRSELQAMLAELKSMRKMVE